MLYAKTLLSLSMALTTMAAMGGCSTSGPTNSSDTAAVTPVAVTAESAKDQAAAASADSDVEQGLAELSPEDRELARKQKVCPVSGEPLGTMGKPDKIVVKGRAVFLCCSGCEEEVQKDPDKYLAKIDAAAQK